MEVYFGTVRRGARLDDSGHVIRFDWDAKEVKSQHPILPDERWTLDDNPRGGARGCRGVVVTGDRVYAMGAHTIHEFDRDLNPIENHSHGLMVGLHEAAMAGGDRIWVASTRINLALEYDLTSRDKTRFFLPRDIPAFIQELDLTPLKVDTEADNRGQWRHHDLKADASHLHLNAVAASGERVLALFNRFGAIVDLTEERVIARDPALERGHNIEVLDDGTLVSVDTHGRTVRFYDGDNGTLVHVVDLMTFPWVRALRRSAKQTQHAGLAKALFTRGLAFDGEHFLVGTSPASLLLVNWRTSTLEDAYQHSEDLRVAIHGLAVAPEG